MFKWVCAVLSALVGIVAVVLVASALSVAGTDDKTETKEFSVDNGAYAVLLNEQLVPFVHTHATITAHADEDLFIGTANGVDTEDYLTGVAHEEITDIHFPGGLEHRFVPGDAPRAPVADRDWWLDHRTGTTVSKTFDLDSERQTVVIAPAKGEKPLHDARVSMSMEVKGVFAFCIIGIAVAVLAFGISAFLLLRIWKNRLRPTPRGPRDERGQKADRARDEAFAAAGVTSGAPAAASAPPQSRPAPTDAHADADPVTEPAGEPSAEQPAGEPAAEPSGADATPRPAPSPRRERRRRKRKNTFTGSSDDDRGSRQRSEYSRTTQRRAGKHMRRTLSVGAGMAAVALGASGCAPLPIAQPERPEVTPFERAPLRSGEAGEFLTDYSASLGSALSHNGKGLDDIQSGPLLNRTRAEVKIAKATKQKLSAVGFSSVIAGGPRFSKYPMWFMAFGTAKQSDQGVQAMLVQRDSASSDWKADQGLFVPTEDVPDLRAHDGVVERAPGSFNDVAGAAAKQLGAELETGKTPKEHPAQISGGAVKSFRTYVDGFSKGEDPFKDVTATCTDPAGGKAQRALATGDGGAVALGELRCSVTFSVPADYSVNMGAAVKAVMTTADDGDRIRIDTAVPYMLTREGEKTKAVTSDWFLISSQTSKSAKKKDSKKESTKTASPDSQGDGGASAGPQKDN